ncbi:flagellin lysine-N-methylase [Yersinia frederiksenii]|uniref:flagellin lysine-N-methylase n=1 Tax=Yersinia frederiksenii TaxID=29484 RepID=UPI0028F3E3E4|nr:flagellin lysine-N-methylase [Yersinia frederiksenii]
MIQPDFVKKFSCVGSACRDHCCNGWDISIDKNTYRKYKNSQNQTIRNIAIKNVSVTRTNTVDWAKIRLKEDGNCPYLDEARLCEVHKRLGSAALSQTCSTYSRSHHQYQTETFDTLTLSCPEVTRLVLFNPNAFSLHPHILRNLFQYNFYHNKFALDDTDNLVESFYRYTIDFFISKSVISAFVVYNDSLSEDDIINIVYAYNIFSIHYGGAKKFCYQT